MAAANWLRIKLTFTRLRVETHQTVITGLTKTGGRGCRRSFCRPALPAVLPGLCQPQAQQLLGHQGGGGQVSGRRFSAPMLPTQDTHIAGVSNELCL